MMPQLPSERSGEEHHMRDPNAIVDESDETREELEEPAGAPVVEDELLVEDVSIDGMCGVY
jgi:mycofactocin precursor